MKLLLKNNILAVATLIILTCSCSKKENEGIIREVWWENNYIITNSTNSKIIVKSYLSTAINGQLRIDSIKPTTSNEILQLNGIGTNEYLELNAVFDSLIITNLASGELLYFSDLSTGMEEWVITEVNPEITLNYELTVTNE